MGKALFVTGTDTDVGKTYVTGLIVKKLRTAGERAGYYKAALSGAERAADGTLLPGDALFVQRTAGLGFEDVTVSYVYEEALSPHLAAARSGQPVDFARVKRDFDAARARTGFLTVEGSGGITCPLRWDEMVHLCLDDVVAALELPVLLVANAGLGTLNAIVLSCEHLRARNIPVRGILLNHFHAGDFLEEDNRRMAEEMTGVPVVATVADGDTELAIDTKQLLSFYA